MTVLEKKRIEHGQLWMITKMQPTDVRRDKAELTENSNLLSSGAPGGSGEIEDMQNQIL